MKHKARAEKEKLEKEAKTQPKKIITSNMKLADVLPLIKNNDPNLEVLDLKNKSLKDSDIDDLVDALETNNTVFELDLDNNYGITNESIAALADLIEFNKHLQVIVFEKTGITENAEFVSALEKNFVLRDLVLSECATDEELARVEQLLDRNEAKRKLAS